MFKTEPTYYQKEIFERSINMPYAALFLEQGLGKSKIEIDTTCQLYKDGKLDGLLVISNKAVAENWYINEINKHIWDSIPCCMLLWGRNTRSEIDLINLTKQRGPLRVFCINVEALRTPKVHLLVERLLKSGKFKILVDESTLIKNPTAVQSRRCLSLAKHAAYTRILSGEPAPNGPMDLYHQYKFLSPFALPGYTKDSFTHSFCEIETRWVGAKKDEAAGKKFTLSGQKLFEQMIGQFTFRLRKADVDSSLVKFPAIDAKIVPVQMTPEQTKLYDEVLINVKTELQGILGEQGTIRADVIISRLIKLHQITSGFVTLEDGKQYRFDHNPKMEKLISCICDMMDERAIPPTDSPPPVIIWAHYRSDVDAITAKLQALWPGKVARIYGGISDNERITNLERFMSGQVPILVANPQSIGHGLTLTVADTAIYFSNHYNYEYKVQSRDRIHRLGQVAETVHYIDLVMQDSIDEQIIAALRHKEGFCNSLFKSEWIQRVLGIPAPEVVVGEEPEDSEFN